MSQRPYRGLTKDGKWVYGWYVEYNERYYISSLELEKDYSKTFDESFIEVIPETVGQSTGDIMHGKKIFAGDILEYWFGAPWNPEEPVRVIGRVIWQNSGWWFRCAGEYDGHLADVGEGKLIGNIHENPELLEEKK